MTRVHTRFKHCPETASNEAERQQPYAALARLLNAVVLGCEKEWGQLKASCSAQVWKFPQKPERNPPTWCEEGSKGTQQVAGHRLL